MKFTLVIFYSLVDMVTCETPYGHLWDTKRFRLFVKSNFNARIFINALTYCLPILCIHILYIFSVFIYTNYMVSGAIWITTVKWEEFITIAIIQRMVFTKIGILDEAAQFYLYPFILHNNKGTCGVLIFLKL